MRPNSMSAATATGFFRMVSALPRKLPDAIQAAAISASNTLSMAVEIGIEKPSAMARTRAHASAWRLNVSMRMAGGKCRAHSTGFACRPRTPPGRLILAVVGPPARGLGAPGVIALALLAVEPRAQFSEPRAVFPARLGDAQFRMRRRQAVLVRREQLFVEFLARPETAIHDLDLVFGETGQADQGAREVRDQHRRP